MTEKVKKYLFDIKLAIHLIEIFTETTSSYIAYQNDLKTQSAVERQLAIIGEALVKIKKEEKDLIIKNDKKIIGFRNRLVHAYDSIDNTIVWVVIKKYLPQLKTEVENLI